MLCYKNNRDIIKMLLNVNTKYQIKDQDNNNILHYLVNIENHIFFKDIFTATPVIQEKFCKMINLKNNNKKSPLDVIKYKIELNIKNFYSIDKDTELIYSELFSDELNIKAITNNELNSIIPTNLKDIFNDLYIIFNLHDVNKDIIDVDYLNNTFNYTKTGPKINDAPIIDLDNICTEHYVFLQKRHLLDKNMETNEYYERFFNTLAHVITLHFSSTFFVLLKELLLKESTNDKRIGMSDDILKELQKSIFTFDPKYENMNLAQLMILNIYKAKFNKEIIEDKTLGSLKDILKFKLSILNTIIIEDRLIEFNEAVDKIIDHMNIFFDLFNKKIILFLTNYVKFVELQYNLQQIRNILQENA